MRFGFFTDSHFSFKNDNRMDNALQTSIKKLKQALRWFKKNKCDFVICGGDLFDRHRQLNFDLLYSVFQAIKSQSLKVYYIMGNHDQQGYRWQTVEKATVGFVQKICGGKLVFVQDMLQVKGCNIYACHAGQDIVERTKDITKSQNVNIVVAHCLLADNNSKGCININVIDNTNIDLVLSGDLHDGYRFQKNKHGIDCYNPGSMMRLSRSDKDRKPKVAFFDVSDFMGQRTLTIQQKILKHKSSQQIFTIKEQTLQVQKQISGDESYISSFKQFKSTSKDIFEVLQKIGKQENIETEVLQMIKIYKDKMTIVE